MLANIVLYVQGIVHHPGEHGNRGDWRSVDYGRGPSPTGIEEAPLRLQHVQAEEKVRLAIGNDGGDFGLALGVEDVG